MHAARSDLDHALAKILHDWTHSNADAEAQVYAEQITSLCDAKEVEPFCWTLWQAVIDAAQLASGTSAVSQIERLAHLVEAIKNSKPLMDENGKNLACWGGECWKDLPLLGPQMRENWNTSPSNPSELAAHLSKNILAARLTQRKVADFSLYGLWALREALEGDIPFSPGGPLEYTVPVAHAWIMHAGDVLFQLDDDRGTIARGGSLWSGQYGFCKARWSFWKHRLAELSASAELSSSMRTLAEDGSNRINFLS